MSFRKLFKPVGTVRLDLVGTPVTTAAWIQVTASLPAPSSAVEIFNGSNSLLKLSTGAAGLEAASVVPYMLLPGTSTILPMELNRLSRISVIAVDRTANVESLVLNFFG